MKVIFANVTHGFVYASDLKQPEGMIFRKFSIPDYVEYFKSQSPDILCLSEVLIDDQNDNSEFVTSLSQVCELPYYKVLRSEKSWIYVGRYYGMAILSKYPISSYEFFKLPNPKFEVDRPNGDHWIMHDKYAQFTQIAIGKKNLNLFNLHYFPVHHFKRKLSDPEMATSRKALVDYFLSKGADLPVIIAGDFNNKESKLFDTFPELEKANLKEVIEVDTTILDGNAQLDHILFSPKTLSASNSKTEKFLSDHYSIISEIDFV